MVTEVFMKIVNIGDPRIIISNPDTMFGYFGWPTAKRLKDGRIAVVVAPADGCKCDRCWAYSTKGISEGEGFLCERCQNILAL